MTVEAMVEAVRCQHALKRERQLQYLPAATAAAAVVVRPSRASRPEGLAGATTARSSPRIRNRSIATYDVPTWANGRPSQVVFSSAGAAGLTITWTTHHGQHRWYSGKSLNAKQGARQGQGLSVGPVAHDGGRSFCATATSAGLDGAVI